MRAALYLPLCLLMCWAPEGRAEDFIVETRIDLGDLERSRGVVPAVRPRVVDRGRRLFLGASERSRGAELHFLNLEDQRVSSARVRLRGVSELPKVMFYDEAHERGGLAVTVRRGTAYGLHFAHWNVRDGRIDRYVKLAQVTRRGDAAELKPIGYDTTRRRFYLAEVRLRAGRPQQRDVSLIGITDRSTPVNIARVDTGPIHGVHFDPARERALLVEYAELPKRTATAWLVHLPSRSVTKLTLPSTAYGVAFLEDGQLRVYSSQTGALWAIDPDSGTRRKLRSVGPLGHALGALPRVDSNELLLIRNSALHVVDADTGRTRTKLPTEDLFQGFVHTEGSIVSQGRAILVNGQSLAVVRVQR